MLSGFDDKSGYALCLFAYMDSDLESPVVFEGRTDGTIVRARSKGNGFGWDPIFQPEGFQETYGEMEKEVKNRISHRYKALEKVQAYLKARNNL